MPSGSCGKLHGSTGGRALPGIRRSVKIACLVSKEATELGD